MNKKIETIVKSKCEQFAKKFWNLEFNLPIEYSGRMKNVLGKLTSLRVISTNVVTPQKITFAHKLFEYHDEETVDGVIKHELAHWALLIQGKPNQDGHPVFEKELVKIGAPSTKVIEFTGEKHVVVCSECSKIVATRNSESTAKKLCSPNYKTNCCRGNLVYNGKKEIGDKSKGFLAQVMNTQTKVQPPKQNKQATQKVQPPSNTMKPAEKIKALFASIMNSLTKQQINNLTNPEFCDKTFGLKYAFLKEFKNDSDRKVNGHNRYYSGTITINGKQYIMTNDLYNKTANLFEIWVNS